MTETCHICGCTDEDCSGCIARTGTSCQWVHDWKKGEKPLCSACLSPITKSIPADPASVELVFDEAKRAAVAYIDRMQRAQQQTEYIIATVYVNLKIDAIYDPMTLVRWMDEEIKKLNEIKKS